MKWTKDQARYWLRLHTAHIYDSPYPEEGEEGQEPLPTARQRVIRKLMEDIAARMTVADIERLERLMINVWQESADRRPTEGGEDA